MYGPVAGRSRSRVSGDFAGTAYAGERANLNKKSGSDRVRWNVTVRERESTSIPCERSQRVVVHAFAPTTSTKNEPIKQHGFAREMATDRSIARRKSAGWTSWPVE